jgi:hypothetical protein
MFISYILVVSFPANTSRCCFARKIRSISPEEQGVGLKDKEKILGNIHFWCLFTNLYILRILKGSVVK